MKVLIAGAGIGGLTAALSMRAAGLEDIEVVEAAERIRPLGVGLNILPNAVRELTGLGVYDRLAERAIRTQELAFYNRHGQLIWSEPRGTAAGYRWPQLSVHRGHLQMVLLAAVQERLGAGAVTTGARITRFTSPADGRVRAELAHSTGVTTTREADVLVGADGIRSAVRAGLYPAEGEPPGNGMVMWRGTTWTEPYLTGRSMIVTGDGTQRIVLYPIGADPRSGQVLVNWVAARPAGGDLPGRGDWNRVVPAAKVLKHFGDWRFDWLDIPGVLGRAPTVLEYPVVDRDPLPRWTFGTFGRVTLLGDAAHAMYPMGSNGATQSIIDGRALAHRLATHADIDEALAAYERDRRPTTTRLQHSNRQMGPEIVISIAHQRAPDGFDDIADVIPAAELAEISHRYATIGGFDVQTVNNSPNPIDEHTIAKARPRSNP